MKTWVKLYTEIIDDPDMASLPWAHRGIWSALLALAGKLDARDDDELETGELADIGRVAWYLRCTTDELSDAVAEFTARGMVDDRDGVLFLTNYAKRQKRAPSAAPNVARERVSAWRAKDRAKADDGELVTSSLHASYTEDETSALRDCNAPRIDKSRIDTEEKRVEPAAAPFRAQIRAFESTIGLLSGQLMGQEITDTLAELEQRGVSDWWQLAIDQAAVHNKRSWAYVRGILRNCMASGTPPGQPRDAQPRASPDPPRKRIEDQYPPDVLAAHIESEMKRRYGVDQL